jgi:hypothetical protein
MLLVPCEWAEWGEFTECSASCGGGHHTRSRVIASPPLHGGAACEGDAFESANCNLDPCPGKFNLVCDKLQYERLTYYIIYIVNTIYFLVASIEPRK